MGNDINAFMCVYIFVIYMMYVYSLLDIYLFFKMQLHLKIFIYLAALGLSCGTQDLRSSLRRGGSLVAACEI